jgi:hypothetical protein
MFTDRSRTLASRFAGVLSVAVVTSALFASNGATLPVLPSPVATSSSFDRLGDVEELRATFARKAVDAIGLEGSRYRPELRYSGLTRTQANSVLAIAERFGSRDFSAAVRVAWCESRLNPHSISRANRNGSRDHGLFQLNDDGTMQRLGVTRSTALDVTANVDAAWVLLEDRGWSPWTCAHMLGLGNAKMRGEAPPTDPALKAAKIANKEFHAAKAAKAKAAKAKAAKAAKLKAAKEKTAKLAKEQAAKVKAAKEKAEKAAKLANQGSGSAGS